MQEPEVINSISSSSFVSKEYVDDNIIKVPVICDRRLPPLEITSVEGEIKC